jgi:hypothetical protein
VKERASAQALLFSEPIAPVRRVNVDASRGRTRLGMSQKYDTIANLKNALRGSREVVQFGSVNGPSCTIPL